jgi:hypothetical protein
MEARWLWCCVQEVVEASFETSAEGAPCLFPIVCIWFVLIVVILMSKPIITLPVLDRTSLYLGGDTSEAGKSYHQYLGIDYNTTMPLEYVCRTM